MASATVSAAVATASVELPTCPICLSEYRSGLRKPFDLGCGHCICGRCYASLSVTGPRTCPIDRSPWNNPHTAYELLHLLEQLQKSHGTTPDAGPDVTPNPEFQPQRRGDPPCWNGYDPFRAVAGVLLHYSDLWRAVTRSSSPDEDNTEMDFQELCGHLSLLLPSWFSDAFWLALPGLIAALLCYSWRFIAATAILVMPCMLTVAGMVEVQQPTSPGFAAAMAAGFLGTMVGLRTLLASGLLQQLLSFTMLCVLVVWLVVLLTRRGPIALLRRSWLMGIVLAASGWLWWMGMGPAERLGLHYELLRRAMILGVVSGDYVQRADIAAAAVARESRPLLDIQTMLLLLIRGVATPAIFWSMMAWLEGYRSALPGGSAASITTPQARDGSSLFFASNRYELDWLLLRTTVSVGVLCCTGSLRHSTNANVAMYGVFLLLRLIASNLRLLQLLRDEIAALRFSAPTPRAAVTNRVVGRADSVAASNGSSVRRQLRAASMARGARTTQSRLQPRQLLEERNHLTGSLPTGGSEGAPSQSALVAPRQSQAAFNNPARPATGSSHKDIPTAAAAVAEAVPGPRPALGPRFAALWPEQSWPVRADHQAPVPPPRPQHLSASSAAVSASASQLQRTQVPQAGSATRAEASPNTVPGTAAAEPSHALMDCLTSAAEANGNGEGGGSPTDASILTPELEQPTTAQLRAEFDVLLHNKDRGSTEVAASSLDMQAMFELGDGSDGVQTGAGASSMEVPLQVTPSIVAAPTPGSQAVPTTSLAAPQHNGIGVGAPTSESVSPTVDHLSESQPTEVSAATSAAAVMASQSAILPTLSVAAATITPGTSASPVAVVSTAADVLRHQSPGAPSIWPSFAAEMPYARAAAEGHGLLGGSSRLTDNPSTGAALAMATPGIFRFVGQPPPADSATVQLTADPRQRLSSWDTGSRTGIDNSSTAAISGRDVNLSDGSAGARPVAFSIDAAGVISEAHAMRRVEVDGSTSGLTVTRSRAMARSPMLAARGRGRGSREITGAGHTSNPSQSYAAFSASASGRTNRSLNAAGSVHVAAAGDNMRPEARAGNGTGHVNGLGAESPRVGAVMGSGFGLEADSGAGATTGSHTTGNAGIEDAGILHWGIAARAALATADRLNAVVATATRASASAGAGNAGRYQTDLLAMQRRGGVFDGLVWAFTLLTLVQWALHVPPWPFVLAAMDNLLGWLVPTLRCASSVIIFSLSFRLVLLYRTGRLKHALLPCGSIYGIWDVHTSFCFNLGVLAAALLPRLFGDRWASLYTMYLGLATNAELIGRMTLVLLQPLRYVDPPPLLSLPLLPVVAMWLFWSSNARRMWKWPFINIQGARNLGLPVFLAAAALGLDPALSERLVLLLARTLSYWVRGGRAARRRGFLGNVFMVIQSGTEITDMRLAETLASLQRVDRGGGWGWLLVSLLVPVLAAIQALVVRLWRWSVVQLERVEFEELVEEMRAARDHGTGGVVMPTRR